MSILGLGTDDDDGATAGTRQSKQETLSQANVDRFLAAAHDNLLTAEEIGLVVFDATKGRTTDPADVYVTEVAALREALDRHTHDTEGVSQKILSWRVSRPAPPRRIPGGSAPATRPPRTNRYRSRTPMPDVRPYPPWWQDRYDQLDDLDLALEEPSEPAPTSWYDVDQPRVDSYWDELRERDDQ